MRGLYRQLNRLRTTISLDSTLTLVPPAACAPLAAGFLTKRGFLQASLVRSLKRIKVADVMKQPVIRVAAETPIKKALEVGGKASASRPTTFAVPGAAPGRNGVPAHSKPSAMSAHDPERPFPASADSSDSALNTALPPSL